MNPLTINPLYLLVALAIAGGGGFFTGWETQGWRKDKVIAEEKASRAADRTLQTTAALTNLTEATKLIHKAAEGYAANEDVLGVKIDAVRKALKNVQAKTPLPPDCRPDSERLRILKTAVDSANTAGS